MNNTKKVGILTFSYSSNPGSVLQAYVLQETISHFENYYATIINYQKTSAGKPVIGKTVFYKPIKKWTLKKIIEWSARIVAHPIRMRKYEKFFKCHYNNYSAIPIKKDNLCNIENNYDCFVVGSDQVWNFDSYNVDETYFLDFVNDGRKKISYAASFGSAGITESRKELACSLIKDFSSISVREEDSVKTVFDLTQKEAAWVLDPSLLWNKEQYSIMALPPKKSKYVFLYLREESPALQNFADNLARTYGLSVIKVIKHWRCNKKGRPISALGPKEWLGFMQNADFIVTNSFHGICFSIIFEKEFFVDLLKGGASHTNTRMESLLRQFDLCTRATNEISDFTDIEKVDYSRVNAIRELRRKYSLEYLKNALDGSTEKL